MAMTGRKNQSWQVLWENIYADVLEETSFDVAKQKRDKSNWHNNDVF